MYINVENVYDKNALGDLGKFHAGPHNFDSGEWETFKNNYIDALAVYYLQNTDHRWVQPLKTWLPVLLGGAAGIPLSVLSGLFNPIVKAKTWMATHFIHNSEWTTKVVPEYQQRADEIALAAKKRQEEHDKMFPPETPPADTTPPPSGTPYTPPSGTPYTPPSGTPYTPPMTPPSVTGGYQGNVYSQGRQPMSPTPPNNNKMLYIGGGVLLLSVVGLMLFSKKR